MQSYQVVNDFKKSTHPVFHYGLIPDNNAFEMAVNQFLSYEDLIKLRIPNG